MTDADFFLAKQLKEQIDYLESLGSRLHKIYHKIKRDEFDKDETLELLSKLGDTVQSLKKIRKQEFEKL